MRLIFMGTPAFSVSVLDQLISAGHEIACVYSQPPRPAGRGKKQRPSPVHQRAEELGLEAVDAGPLGIARHLEPLAMLYIHLAVKKGWGSNCAFKILKRSKT